MLPEVSLPPIDAVPEPLAEKEGVVAAEVTTAEAAAPVVDWPQTQILVH